MNRGRRDHIRRSILRARTPNRPWSKARVFMHMNFHDRMVHDPAICSGKPVRGTRVLVRVIPGYLAQGEPTEVILRELPSFTDDDVIPSPPPRRSRICRQPSPTIPGTCVVSIHSKKSNAVTLDIPEAIFSRRQIGGRRQPPDSLPILHARKGKSPALVGSQIAPAGNGTL